MIFLSNIDLNSPPQQYLTNKIQEAQTKFLVNREEKIKILKNKTELTHQDEQQLAQFELEITSLTNQTSELNIDDYDDYDDYDDDTNSLNWQSWKDIVKARVQIPGTIEQIIPLPNNQFIIINKVKLYAIRLFEYKENQLTELARYAKNKVGYANLASTLGKVNRLLTNRESDNESLLTISQIGSSSQLDLTNYQDFDQLITQIQIPPKNN